MGFFEKLRQTFLVQIHMDKYKKGINNLTTSLIFLIKC